MASSENELLGIVVRQDREALGLTQDQLDRKLFFNAHQFKARTFAGGCGLIERFLRREISVNERKLLAHCLNQPTDRYLNLPTDPRKYIGKILAKKQKDSSKVLERSIVFPPEYKQAGVSILSYFSEVLTSKYPDEPAEVSISQNGNNVTLRVETREGKIEKIEKTLEQYGLVVTGQLPMEKFTDDKELIRDLKTKLEVTSLELRLRKEAFLEQKTEYENRVGSLEEQVKNLYGLVSTGLQQANSLHEVIKNLASQAKLNAKAVSSLEKISDLAKETYSKERAQCLVQAFREVQAESPSFYQYLRSTLASIPGGIMGNLATPWVQGLINSLPK